MKYLDTRSDTVTHPTPEMRAAMAAAEVGDDVYRDDPTVNRLQELAAEMVGKEAALFVPSGTMGNQLAIMTHTRRGDDVICLRNSHVFVHEVGAAAILSGVTLNPVDPEDGIMTAELCARAIREDDLHCPPTTLLCTENPLAIGKAVPLETCRETYAFAKSKGLNVHMDGARLFNAADALGCSVKEIAACTDSVMFCLSKGLCAPVGSILAGPKEFIERAIKNRKILGGGMRQAGIIAAAGILSLEVMAKRIGEDNRNAAVWADKLDTLPGVSVVRGGIPINMVFFTIDLPEAALLALPARMEARGVLMNGISDGLFRFVAHNDITPEDMDTVTAVLGEEIAALR